MLYGRFDAGTHWEGYARFPQYPGYSSVGEVVAGAIEKYLDALERR